MKENKIKKEYEINPITVAIIAEKVDGNYISQVIESNGAINYVKQSPISLIDFACQYFGSTLQGRQESARKILNAKHKVPISINPLCGMYFFPTVSPQHPFCSWISHSYVNCVHEAPENRTEFIFKNGSSITLDVSYGSMVNQLQRTAQFRYLLEERIHFKKKSIRYYRKDDDDHYHHICT
ncbi:Competence transcription factor [Paraliobacillus sp. PM-2]|uniref:competence protein ComK n=1 Tax=Paraliobacillus sp. PM-2 TaxID=1462524 RepID=UPI00061C3172|nr:competence protein ComK [Paraliobacillus sp. PM-2]CQR47019.1 Competence transcription factor [Paraliobacillus sp. PM-2]